MDFYFLPFHLNVVLIYNTIMLHALCSTRNRSNLILFVTAIIKTAIFSILAYQRQQPTDM